MTTRIRGDLKDARAAYEYWLDSPIFGFKRQCRSPDDFGGADTVTKCLKRRLRYDDLDLGADTGVIDFGIYLGQHKDGWIVGLVDIGGRLAGAEVFESLAELQQAWELD